MQYGLVFGAAHLSALLSSPAFALWTGKIGPGRVFNTGTVLQFLPGGILFAGLAYVRRPEEFVGIGCLLRFELRARKPGTPCGL